MSFFDHQDFDMVRTEKAHAMRKYKRNRYLVFCLKLILPLLLLSLFFIALRPVVQSFCSHHLSSLTNHQFRVFLLINAIVFLVYTLSTANSNSKNDIKSETHVVSLQPDLYDEYVSITARRRTAPDEENKKQLVVVSESYDVVQDKQIIACSEYTNARSGMAAEENLVRDLTVTEFYTVRKTTEKQYVRTRSERYVREDEEKKKKKLLRRSETERGKEIVVAAAAARKSMEEMNSEEFRMTIDRYIERKKKTLRDENLAVLTEEKTGHMSVTCM